MSVQTIDFEGWAVIWRRPMDRTTTLIAGLVDQAEAEAFAQLRRLDYAEILYVGEAAELLRRIEREGGEGR